MPERVDIWSKGEVVGYIRELLSAGQVKDCSHLRLERGHLKAYYPRCIDNWASRVPANNVPTDPTAYRAPSGYSWPRCPNDCPQYHKSRDFVATLAGESAGSDSDSEHEHTREADRSVSSASVNSVNVRGFSEQAPPEIKESLERFRRDYPDAHKVAFLMMRFGRTKAHEDIVTGIKTALDPLGVTVVRADDKQYHDDLFPNVLTYVYGCRFGIAVFERIETEQFNPNVALEVGYMFALKKEICLLKDRTLNTLPADLVGKLYRVFDPLDAIATIPQELSRWLKDKDFGGAAQGGAQVVGFREHRESNRVDYLNLGVNLGWLQQGSKFGGRPISSMAADLERVRAARYTDNEAMGLITAAQRELQSSQRAESVLDAISDLITLFLGQAGGSAAEALNLGVVLGCLQQGAMANNLPLSLATSNLESARMHASMAGYHSFNGFLDNAFTKLSSGQPVSSISPEITHLMGLFQGQC